MLRIKSLSRMNFGSMPRKFSMQEIESHWTDSRLDKAVMAKLGMPWADAHKYIRQRDIFVAKGGKEQVPESEKYVTRQTNYKVQFGDILCISDYLIASLKAKGRELKNKEEPQRFSKDKTKQMAQKFESMLVYENDDVLVIEKPCGVPSQMGSGLDPHSQASVDVLSKAYLEQQSNGMQSYLVHRLDKATSGLMCLAKNKEMAKRLATEMSERTITKQYTALLSDYSTIFPFPLQGVVRQSLAEPEKMWSVQDTQAVQSSSKSRKFICSPDFQVKDNDSLTMVTFYQILRSVTFDKESWVDFDASKSEVAKKEIENYHLVQFELETGKKHQIRLASAMALGSAIVGDFKYGYDSQLQSKDLLRRSLKYTKLQERKLFDESILLHSSKLEIPVKINSTDQKSFQSDITDPETDIRGAQTFVKVLEQLGLR